MFDTPNGIFVVVVNAEEQYSLWPHARALPPGWRSTGFEGSKEACLNEISRAWIDMRPKSLRDAQ